MPDRKDVTRFGKWRKKEFSGRSLFGKVDKPFHHKGNHKNHPDNETQNQEFYEYLKHERLLPVATVCDSSWANGEGKILCFSKGNFDCELVNPCRLSPAFSTLDFFPKGIIHVLQKKGGE